MSLYNDDRRYGNDEERSEWKQELTRECRADNEEPEYSYYNCQTGSDIICPYCGAAYEPSYEGTYIGNICVECYEDGKEQECTCNSCGKRFTVIPSLSWEYTTETIDGEMTEEEHDELEERNA